jgi:hypothetical protein
LNLSGTINTFNAMRDLSRARAQSAIQKSRLEIIKRDKQIGIIFMKPDSQLAFPNHPHDRVANVCELSGPQPARVPGYEAGMSGEQFPRAHIAGESQPAAGEITGAQSNSVRVAVGLAGDLA